jgi:hypothetical protein
MLQIFQSFIRWTPVGVGSYFTISLFTSSQWIPAAIALSTTLIWLGLTHTQGLFQWLINITKEIANFIAQTIVRLMFAILLAAIYILIASICGMWLGAILHIACIPFDPSWNSIDNLMKGSIVICQIIGGLIGFCQGLAKSWD